MLLGAFLGGRGGFAPANVGDITNPFSEASVREPESKRASARRDIEACLFPQRPALEHHPALIGRPLASAPARWLICYPPLPAAPG